MQYRRLQIFESEFADLWWLMLNLRENCNTLYSEQSDLWKATYCAGHVRRWLQMQIGADDYCEIFADEPFPILDSMSLDTNVTNLI